MIWRYVSGTGWVLQPAVPAASGCVVTPGVSPGFGFRRAFNSVHQTLRRVHLVLHVIATVSAAIILGWLWFTGFRIEVAVAVLAAAVYGELASLGKNIRNGLRRLRTYPHRGDVL